MFLEKKLAIGRGFESLLEYLFDFSLVQGGNKKNLRPIHTHRIHRLCHGGVAVSAGVELHEPFGKHAAERYEHCYF